MPNESPPPPTAEKATPLLSMPMVLPEGSMYQVPAVFEHMQRVAGAFAQSNMVPKHLRENRGDLVIALDIAMQMRESPLMVMQNIYFVHGNAGWKTQYMIARANRSGVFKSRIHWKEEGRGDQLVVTAYAIMADSGERVEARCSMAMAKAEGWVQNAKYKTMPEHMLKWRSACFLIRLYAPEVMMGYQTIEEIEDTMAAGGTLRAGPDGVYSPEIGNRVSVEAEPPIDGASEATEQNGGPAREGAPTAEEPAPTGTEAESKPAPSAPAAAPAPSAAKAETKPAADKIPVAQRRFAHKTGDPFDAFDKSMREAIRDAAGEAEVTKLWLSHRPILEDYERLAGEGFQALIDARDAKIDALRG